MQSMLEERPRTSKKKKVGRKVVAPTRGLSPLPYGIAPPVPEGPVLVEPGVAVVAEPEVFVVSEPVAESVPAVECTYIEVSRPSSPALQVPERAPSTPVIPARYPPSLHLPAAPVPVPSPTNTTPICVPHMEDDLASVISISSTSSSPAINPLRLSSHRDNSESLASVVSLPPTPEFKCDDRPVLLDTEGHRKGVEDTASVVFHPKYHFSDGSIHCQAENTLFCIHKHVRELSPTLAEIFPANHPFDQDIVYFPGNQPPLRIVLHEVKAAEFEALLDMIYTPLYAAKTLNQNTFLRALPLSTKWGLGDLRSFIISQLETNLSLVERYHLAQEHHIQEWEESCLSSLVTRPERLTAEEGHKLGVETTVFVSGLREEARTRNLCLHRCIACDSKPHLNGQNVDIGFVGGQVKEWLNRMK